MLPYDITAYASHPEYTVARTAFRAAMYLWLIAHLLVTVCTIACLFELAAPLWHASMPSMRCVRYFPLILMGIASCVEVIGSIVSLRSVRYSKSPPHSLTNATPHGCAHTVCVTRNAAKRTSFSDGAGEVKNKRGVPNVLVE